MISAIGSASSFLSSLFGTNGTNSSNASSSLAQTEEQLFASIDTNGDGSISQSEFSGFLNKTAAAAGDNASQTQAANSLFAQMSGGSGSISLQQFEANAGGLVNQLQSEIAVGSASGTGSSSTTSDLLSQLTQSAQTLAAGSAASIASSSSSTTASSNTSNTGSTGHHHHHGHGGGSPLISQFLQQYQATGATSTPVVSTLSASA